jgi:hypothetical protein
MNERHAGGVHRLATEHWPVCLAASGKMDVLLAAMAGVLVAAVNVIGVFCFKLRPKPKHLARRRPNVQFDIVEPLHQGKLDGLPQGSNRMANACTSNQEAVQVPDFATSAAFVLHAIDATGIVKAMALRMQALVLQTKKRVFPGCH